MATHWPRRIRKTGGKGKTCSRWLLRILLESLFLQSCLGQATIPAKAYTPVELSSQTLSTAATSKKFITTSLLQCALQASQRDWVLLMCYEDNKCTLYDLPVQAKTYQRESPYAAVIHCYTNLDRECVYNGEVIQEPGKQLTEWKDLNCEDGLYTLVPNPVALDRDFNEFQLFDRPIYVRKLGLATWAQAIEKCTDYALKLFTPIDDDDFKDFRSVMQDNLLEHYWVGERNGTWLNGKVTQPQEKYPLAIIINLPNFDCGKVSIIGTFLLEPFDCNVYYYFVCH